MKLKKVKKEQVQEQLTTSRETENSPLYAMMEETYQTPEEVIEVEISAGELKAVRNAVNYHNSKLADGRGKYSTKAVLDSKGAGTVYVYLKEAKGSIETETQKEATK